MVSHYGLLLLVCCCGSCYCNGKHIDEAIPLKIYDNWQWKNIRQQKHYSSNALRPIGCMRFPLYSKSRAIFGIMVCNFVARHYLNRCVFQWLNLHLNFWISNSIKIYWDIFSNENVQLNRCVAVMLPSKPVASAIFNWKLHNHTNSQHNYDNISNLRHWKNLNAWNFHSITIYFITAATL